MATNTSTQKRHDNEPRPGRHTPPPAKEIIDDAGDVGTAGSEGGGLDPGERQDADKSAAGERKMYAGLDISKWLVVAMVIFASVTSVSGSQQAQGRDHGDFIRTANEAGMMAVAAGKLAEKQAGDQNVKTFARRMADDHTKTLKELAALSKSRHIVHPEYEDAKRRPGQVARRRV